MTSRAAIGIEETFQTAIGGTIRKVGEHIQDFNKCFFGYRADWKKRAKSFRVGSMDQ